MNPENKVTQIFQSNTGSYLDNHIREMNNDGYKLIFIHPMMIGIMDPIFLLFWEKVAWKV